MSKTHEDDTASTPDFDESVKFLGRVKWFNNKAGYGFCTVVGAAGGERVGEDVFVHHTGVKVASEQYKYLVQGEYVHFSLRTSESSTHPFQAANLTGVWGGKLMCETRNEQRQQRAAYNTEDGDGDVASAGGVDRAHGRPRRPGAAPQRRRDNRRAVRLQGAGPRDGETWTLTMGSPQRRNTRPRRPRRDNNDEA